jgi:cytochrome c oxidase cbb3-type subunit III
MISVASQARAVDTPADFPASESGPLSVPTTTLFPGGGSPPAEDSRAKIYEGNTQAIAAGQRLFDWYNCSGCHFHGAGGMGPPLLSKQWIYGGRLDQIYATIVQGRPNGMPSWGATIPDNEIWEIAAFVKSLSAPNPANAAGQVMPTSPPPPEPSPNAPQAPTK